MLRDGNNFEFFQKTMISPASNYLLSSWLNDGSKAGFAFEYFLKNSKRLFWSLFWKSFSINSLISANKICTIIFGDELTPTDFELRKRSFMKTAVNFLKFFHIYQMFFFLQQAEIENNFKISKVSNFKTHSTQLFHLWLKIDIHSFIFQTQNHRLCFDYLSVSQGHNWKTLPVVCLSSRLWKELDFSNVKCYSRRSRIFLISYNNKFCKATNHVIHSVKKHALRISFILA